MADTNPAPPGNPVPRSLPHDLIMHALRNGGRQAQALAKARRRGTPKTQWMPRRRIVRVTLDFLVDTYIEEVNKP